MANYSYATLTIPVSADTRQLSLQIRQEATRAGQEAARTLSQTVGSGLRDTAKATGTALRETFAVATGAAVAFGTQVVRAGIAYNTLYQASTKAFTTILGSGKAATQMMDQLTAFAKTSPFPRQAFIQATQQMLAFG